MSEPVNTHEAVAALHGALAKAQGEFPPIKRERTVQVKMKSGGTYTYSYAPLDVILDAVRPLLAKNGLSFVQLLEGDGLRTELRHEGGGSIGSLMPWPSVPRDPQEFGSLITYMRRYTAMAILGIATEDDDDGQAAKPAAETRGRAPKPAKLTLEQVIEELRGRQRRLAQIDKEWTQERIFGQVSAELGEEVHAWVQIPPPMLGELLRKARHATSGIDEALQIEGQDYTDPGPEPEPEFVAPEGALEQSPEGGMAQGNE